MKIFILIIAVITSGFSVVAMPGKHTFKQDDGSTFTGYLKGDEYFTWVEDSNGNIIKYNRKTKSYHYAKVIDINGTVDLVPSNQRVSKYRPSNVRASTAVKVSKKIKQETLSKIWKQKRKALMYHKKK